jgi:hypothetical protein
MGFPKILSFLLAISMDSTLPKLLISWAMHFSRWESSVKPALNAMSTEKFLDCVLSLLKTAASTVDS